MFEVALSAVVLGLLGAGHCLGMCGGFAAALAHAVPQDAKGKRVGLLLAYNIGRVMSYALMGGAVAYAQGLMPESSWPLARTIAGLLLIAAGLYLADIWRGITLLERVGKVLWQRLQPISKKLLPVQTIPKALLLGGLWGWLPCGLVYSVLALAATQPSAAGGALVMAAFGLGTIPAVFGGGLAADALRSWLMKKSIRSLLGLAFVIFGLWTLVVPWYHMSHHAGHEGHHQHGHAHQQDHNQQNQNHHKPQHDHSQHKAEQAAPHAADHHGSHHNTHHNTHDNTHHGHGAETSDSSQSPHHSHH